jgi:hypothetical protein
MNTQTKTFIINITVAVIFFGFFMLCVQTVSNLETRFGAFCTPAIIAAGLAAMCAGFGGFCLIRAVR